MEPGNLKSQQQPRFCIPKGWHAELEHMILSEGGERFFRSCTWVTLGVSNRGALKKQLLEMHQEREQLIIDSCCQKWKTDMQFSNP